MSKRSTQIGVVPYKKDHSRLGIMLLIDGEQSGCIPPDEARYLAHEERDPALRKILLEMADFVDNIPVRLVVPADFGVRLAHQHDSFLSAWCIDSLR